MSRSGPPVLTPPPFIFLGALATGMALQAVWPLRLLPHSLTARLLGGCLVLGGLGGLIGGLLGGGSDRRGMVDEAAPPATLDTGAANPPGTAPSPGTSGQVSDDILDIAREPGNRENTR